MLVEFLATISLGAGAAGIVMLLRHLLRIDLPKWAMPAAAGVAMLAFTIWSEMTWFDRTTAALGPDKIVAQTVEGKTILRPWTLISQPVSRFLALDKGSAVIRDGMVLTDIYAVARWQDGAIVPAAFDCLLARRADLFAGREGDVDDVLEGADWISVGRDDALLRVACDDIR
ncbi:hypothetical protein [Celeribacter arenosi]|uniref:Uncharacterized protein n=1 Tax=Celeribacter arenosi TaxID=792649 RepID=A0ABP7K2U8_9RHOB